MGMFSNTFGGCANLTTVGGPLFSGTLTPAESMFEQMFYNSGITGIPENIFGELTGDGALGMFSNTFARCADLTTVGGPLFSGTLIPVESMFAEMFSGSDITSIPENIFGNLTGDGTPNMFYRTFYNCKNLATADGPLFSGTLTPVESMFAEMFYNSGITGIPENIFGNLTGDGTPNMFFRTFYNCANLTTVGGPLFSGTLTPAESMFEQMFSGSGITSVPENIFGNLTGDGTPNMFYRTFYNCANLTTVGGPLFSGTLTPAESMFGGTFSHTGITSIPANLFGTLNGDGAPRMFEQTFAYCANLTTVGGPLFSGTLTPAESMFSYTFASTAITSIPANLFGTLNGDGAPRMFEWTFSGCNDLTTVESPLFSGTLTPAERMFSYTFTGTAITEIPADLFAGIQGTPASSMFSGTFSGTAITEIPADLFAGIQGAPASYMFDGTFSGTDITEIPADLFAGIQGAPAESMFEDTFSSTAITEIPANLFAGVQGAPANRMFQSTFTWCTQLQSIPADLFAGIQGAPAANMFHSTFSGCDQLQSIPENLFAGISGPATTDMFYYTFASCYSLTGPSARTNGQYLYEIWPDVYYMRTYQNATGLSDYDQIPSNWK